MLTRLVPDIRKTAELVQEVSAASREQNTGIEQTNKALQDLDRVTQQNAAAAEQMAATATELSSQAEQLQTAVGFFKLDSGRPTFRTPAATTARPTSTPRRAPAARPKVIRPAHGGRADNSHHVAGHLASGPVAGSGPGRGGPTSGNGIDLDLGAAPAASDDAMFERY
jgi:methyl-accepting chemotaxis protein